jgi:hypothetical protein
MNMLQVLKSRNGLILSSILIILFAIIVGMQFDSRANNMPPLMDMNIKGGAWFDSSTGSCMIFIRGAVIMRKLGVFSEMQHYAIRIGDDDFYFPQEGQTQHYRRGLEYDKFAGLYVFTLSVDGDDPIQPGDYKYRWLTNCQRSTLL